MNRRLAPLILAVVVSVSPTAGAQTAAPARSPQPKPQIRTSSVAAKFVKALNTGDVGGLLALAQRPFFYRTQEWESAKDGSGFQLGAHEDKRLATRNELDSFFRELTTAVKIESDKPAAKPPSKQSLLADQLKGADRRWTQLDLYVFLRGFGDVEHVAIVGVDRVRFKVAALYVN